MQRQLYFELLLIHHKHSYKEWWLCMEQVSSLCFSFQVRNIQHLFQRERRISGKIWTSFSIAQILVKQEKKPYKINNARWLGTLWIVCYKTCRYFLKNAHSMTLFMALINFRGFLRGELRRDRNQTELMA